MPDPVIRLDHSKTFSTNHGEMTPDDPHYLVRFWQGGTLVYKGRRHTVLLPFDANGALVPDDGKTAPYKVPTVDSNGKSIEITYHPLYSEIQREYLAARLRRAKQTVQETASNQPTIEDDESGAEDPLGSTSESDDVNLVAWLRGEADYKPHKIRTAVRERLGRMHPSITDVLVDLVYDEKMVPEDQVCPRLKEYLDAYNRQRKTIVAETKGDLANVAAA